jgi:hypothetical protein
VVLLLLGPADKQGAVAVEPGVTGFDHPASGPPARRVELELDLLAAGADMGLKAVVVNQVAALGIVVTCIQAETLGRLFSRLRPDDGDRLQRGG